MFFLLIDEGNIYLSDPDVGLMLHFQKGNYESFEQLMDKHYKSVLNFIYRIIGNIEQAEELTQEVFIKIYDQGKKYRPQATFKTWLYVIAKNLSLNEIRKNKYLDTRVIIDDTEVDPAVQNQPDELASQQELADAVRVAIQQLPETQRLAVVLRRYEDLSYAEIATQLRTTEKAVKSLLHRAMTSLEKKLERFVQA